MNTPRHKIFFIHIVISTTLMLILLSVMLLWWYPKGLFGVAGGWDGLKILLPIDMVLGPALTLAFYKPGKKSAVFDLSVIACVQLTALSYGVFAVYSQHPKALVLAENQLQTLTPTDFKAAITELEENKLQANIPSELDENLPPVVVAQAFSKENYGEYLASILNGGLELAHRAERYQDLESGRAALQASHLDQQKIVDALGSDYDTAYDYIPLRSMYGNGIAAFEKDEGALVRIYPRQNKPATAALQK